jgi:hypothetical protein
MLRIIFHLIGRKLLIKAWSNQGVMVVLTSKIGTREGLICGPDSATNPAQRGKIFSRRFGRDACGRQFCFRSAKELFALISRDRKVTWPERKGRMDG